MICLLIGISPPPENESWLQMKENFINFSDHEAGDDIGIEWRGDPFITNDDDNGPTLLVEAVIRTEINPQKFIEALEQWLSNTPISEEDEKAITPSCELWASAPAPLPLRPSMAYEKILKPKFSEQSNDSWIDRSSVSLREWGIIVQEQILQPDQVQELILIVNSSIHEVENSIKTHRPEIIIGKDFFCFQEIASRNLERFDLRLADVGTLNFVETHILGNANIKALLECSLGTRAEIDFDISVVYSRPGACVQGWHADGAHQNGAKDAGWDVDGWKTQLADPYAICLFVPLIDLNDEVGYTQFWPASHRSSKFLGFGPVAEISDSTFDGICNAGDGVWYDYRLLHRGMPNNSKITRPVLQIVFKKRWYVERANYGEEKIIR